MSVQYDMYLQGHKANVAKGFGWIRENLPELIERADYCEWLICYNHDKSKDSAEEYDAYDAYFYGGNRSYKVVQDFKVAWLHHIHNNPHHWQYWILVNDEPEEGDTVLDMPYEYILEMICDWWSFSWKTGKLTEIFNWYADHEKRIKMSDKTRKTVEDILEKIKAKLEENENA